MTDTYCRHLLLVEDNPAGHRLAFVAYVANWANDLGIQVTVLVTSTVVQSVEFEVHMSQCPQVALVTGEGDTIGLAEVARVSQVCESDVTIIFDGDSFLPELVRRGWRGSGCIHVLVMRSPWQSDRFGARHIMKRALIRVLMKRHNICPTLLRGIGQLDVRGVPSCPDPVKWSPNLARTNELKRHLDARRTWFGIFGGMSPRKNVTLFARALLMSGRSDIGLMLAGSWPEKEAYRLDLAVRNLTSSGIPVVTYDHYLDEETFDSAVAAVDYVVIANDGPDSSGVALKGLAAGVHLLIAGSQDLDVISIEAPVVNCKLNLEEIATTVRRLFKPGPTSAIRLPGPNDFAEAICGTCLGQTGGPSSARA